MRNGHPALRLAATLTASLTASLSVHGADLPRAPYLPLATAQALANAALERCAADGYAVSAAVVDAAGVTRALLRADHAGPHTLESSRRKAFTSASLGRPTAELAELIKRMPEVAGLRDMHPSILILGGGLPLRVGGERLGGIGVGGAPGGDLDQACAQAAIAQVLGPP